MDIIEHTQRTKPAVQPGNETTLMHLEGQPGRTAIMNGKEKLFFSGYAYLGMHAVPSFMDRVQEGIKRYGWSFPSSRVSNTRLSLYEGFEKELSELTGLQHTVSFASGYLAGRSAVQLFLHKAHFLVAPGTHPAVSEGLQQFKGSFENWTELVLTQLSATEQFNNSVIVMDSVDPLKGEVRDLSFLRYIERKCTCIIDDSHGIGLINDGVGVAHTLPKNEYIEYVLVYSLSKAFNLNGGAVSTNSEAIAAHLRSLPAYTASTALPPALMHAFLNGAELYQQQRDQLKQNVEYFHELVKGLKVISHPDQRLPIFIFNNEVNELDLLDQDLIISSFAYPDPTGKKIQRVIVNALHTHTDLDTLAAACKTLDRDR